MNQKISIGIKVGLFTLLSQSPAFAQKEVDFKKLGLIADALVSTTVQGDDQIAYAYPKFDLGLSSLAQDRIVYSLRGEVKNTQWKSNVSVLGTTDYRIDRTPNHQGGVIQFSTDKTTDVLAMIRFAAKRTLEKAQALTRNSEIVRALQKAGEVATMRDLYEALLTAQQASLNEINRQLADRGYSNKTELAKTKVAFESISFAINPLTSEITLTVSKPDDLLATAGREDLRAGKITVLRAQINTRSIHSTGEIFVALTDGQINHLHQSLRKRVQFVD